MVQGAKPVLAVDIDDVMAPFGRVFLERFNSQHGTAHKLEDFQNYFFVKELYGLVEDDDAEQYITEFFQWATSANTPLDSSAVAALHKLKAQYDIYVISSRHPDVYDITKRWLQAQMPDTFEDVHFIRTRSQKTSKPQICQEIGAKIMIEDLPDHLLDCAQYGVQGLLFGNYAWNRDVKLPAGVQRVKDWNEVLKVLL